MINLLMPGAIIHCLTRGTLAVARATKQRERAIVPGQLFPHRQAAHP
jgi:hypothetical protein